MLPVPIQCGATDESQLHKTEITNFKYLWAYYKTRTNLYTLLTNYHYVINRVH